MYPLDSEQEWGSVLEKMHESWLASQTWYTIPNVLYDHPETAKLKLACQDYRHVAASSYVSDHVVSLSDYRLSQRLRIIVASVAVHMGVKNGRTSLYILKSQPSHRSVMRSKDRSIRRRFKFGG